MPYKTFFNLNAEPFSNAPATHLFYANKQHESILEKLYYAADSMKGLAVVVGNAGSGKTMLARRLLNRLQGESFKAALMVIVHSEISASWLLQRIALQMGVQKPSNDKLTLLSQLYRKLMQIKESGKKAVILIDEAQMLKSVEIMEEFRGLLNLEVPGHKLISFVFFGLPELDNCLKLDQPLKQRVSLRQELSYLDQQSTCEYIKHRLKLCGSSEEVFTSEALEIIFHFSNGTPRLINTICDNALFEAHLQKQTPIEPSIIEQIVEELSLDSTEEIDSANESDISETALESASRELEAFDSLLKEMEKY